MDRNKLIIPISILLGAIILGGFFYATQVNKQNSIERQQQLKAEEDKRVAEAKAEQDRQEFIAKKKNDCLAIYKTESDKWNNVRGWRYVESDDECYVRFRAPTPKTEAECDADYPTGGDYGLGFLRENMLCKEGEFENLF